MYADEPTRPATQKVLLDKPWCSETRVEVCGRGGGLRVARSKVKVEGGGGGVTRWRMCVCVARQEWRCGWVGGEGGVVWVWVAM